MHRLAVRVSAERAEEARATLAALAPEGWEEAEAAGEVELAVYGGPERLERLRARFGAVVRTPVAEDWDVRWRAFHRPVRVGPLWVGPPWERPPAGAVAVVIDPGHAFGTGSHPTTRLCLELLLELPPTSVLDAGCGSGVLAVAAAKLGFAPVIAVDRDPAAVAAARANAAANGVEVDVRQAHLLGGSLPEAQLGLANLELGLVPLLLERFRGGRLIASGYLEGDRLPCLRRWRKVQRRTLEGWAADLLEHG